MKANLSLDENQDFFSASTADGVTVIHFMDKLLFRATDLRNRDLLLDFMDRVSASRSVKALVLVSSRQKAGSDEYREFFEHIRRPELDRTAFLRMCHGFDQFILRIVNMDKIVLHATSGKVISTLFNVSLACDFRIVSEDTVFHNTYLDLGLIPKGGGVHFLGRKLGIARSLELLLLTKEIPAQKALDLGLVNRVVPLEALEDTALEMAHRFDEVPSLTLSGVKRLLNVSMKDLAEHLELENQELVRILESSRR